MKNIRAFDHGLQGNNHEEADTVIILHCFKIGNMYPFREFVIFCSNRDVLVMLLYHYQNLYTQTRMRVDRDDHKRGILISENLLKGPRSS